MAAGCKQMNAWNSVGWRSLLLALPTFSTSSKEMGMRASLGWVIASAWLVLAGCASTGDGAKWTCASEGLVNSNYTGGDFAMVQLQGFASGGSYKVIKNSAATEAKGVTANGTPFVCKKL